MYGDSVTGGPASSKEGSDLYNRCALSTSLADPANRPETFSMSVDAYHNVCSASDGVLPDPWRCHLVQAESEHGRAGQIWIHAKRWRHSPSLPHRHWCVVVVCPYHVQLWDRQFLMFSGALWTYRMCTSTHLYAQMALNMPGVQYHGQCMVSPVVVIPLPAPGVAAQVHGLVKLDGARPRQRSQRALSERLVLTCR